MENENMDMERYTAADIKRDLLRLYASATYQKLNAYYKHENFFSIIGKSRSENTHSDFLAWLLRSNSRHGMGTYPMEMFLQMLNYAKTLECNNLAIVPDAFNDIAFTKQYIIRKVTARREDTAGNATSGRQRMDLHCEVYFEGRERPLHVVIENKIASPEHDDQTTAYRDHIKKTYRDPSKGPVDDAIFVFLKPLSSVCLEELTKQECVCEDYIQTNYQYLLDYVIQPCMSHEMSDDAKMLLEHYIRCLGDPSYFVDENDNKKRGGMVMAIGQEERELLQKFWEENSNLIGAYLNTIGVEDADDETTSAAIKSLAGKKSFRFNGKLFTSMPQLAVAIVKEYVKTHEDIKYDELKRVFPDEFCSGYGVVFENVKEGKAKKNWDDYRTKADIARFKFKDSIHLPKENIDVVVTNQWGKENFAKFLKGVAETTDFKIDVA